MRHRRPPPRAPSHATQPRRIRPPDRTRRPPAHLTHLIAITSTLCLPLPNNGSATAHLPNPTARVCEPYALLLRREPDGALVTHADLSGLAEEAHPWNEIVVDGRGNVFVNNQGFDFPGGDFAPGTIAVLAGDGSAGQVADGIAFPNGMAVTPDNSTLIVAESYGKKLTAFDIAADGSLSKGRVWADLGEGVPDGICVDADGAVW